MQSEERYQAFVRNSHEGIWCVELDEPIPTDLEPVKQIDLMYERAYLAEANNAMAAMYGYTSPAQLVGARLGDLLVRDDPGNMAYLEAFIASGYSLSGVESRERNKDGNEKVFLNSLVGTLEDGYVVRAWGTQQDVTDQYEAEAALRETNALNEALHIRQEQLVSLNNAKDEFISLASHQLRTPATIVKQYLGLLLEGFRGQLNDDQREFLMLAYKSNERQVQLINELLSVAQADAEKIVTARSDTDIATLLCDVVDEYRPVCRERGHEIILKVPDHPIVTNIDAMLIRIVLENLLDNAAKYSADGEPVKVAAGQENDRAIISVTDKGIGIGQTDIPKLFQKFSRINNPTTVEIGGIGLGLYWAKKIIDLHGGAIAVHSKRRRGTTFTISLPLQPFTGPSCNR